MVHFRHTRPELGEDEHLVTRLMGTSRHTT